MKINKKLYLILTAFNFYFYLLLNNQQQAVVYFFTISFFAALLSNHYLLYKMVQYLTEDRKSTYAFTYTMLKFLVLAIIFYFIPTKYIDILVLSIASYVFQLIILFISIKSNEEKRDRL